MAERVEVARYVVQRVKAAVRPLLPLVHSTALALVLALALLRGEQGEGLVWTGQELERKVASSSVQRAPVQVVRVERVERGARGARVELEMPTWIRMMVDVEA